MHSIGLTTRRAAQLAGVEQHVLLTSLQRHGHWKGVTPRRLPNGRLVWPTDLVLMALGKLPQRTTPATQQRGRLCARTGADPFAAQLTLDALHSPEPTGSSPAERMANLLADGYSHADLTDALDARARQVMQDEELFTPDDWRHMEALAELLEHRARNLCHVLRWKEHAA